MSEDTSVPNTTAKSMFKLMKSLAIGSQTREQIKTSMGLKKIPYDTLIGATKLGFIENNGEELTLCKKYENLVSYHEDHPKVKEAFSDAFIKFKPFELLVKIIKVHGGEIKKKDIGSPLKAQLNGDWKESSQNQYINKLINWGSFGGVISTEKGLIKLHPKYMAGSSVESGNINLKSIFDNYLYDKFCENNLNEICKDLENKHQNSSNNKKKGDKFEDIVSQYFNLLGFSVRTNTGFKEKEIGLSYDPNNGGGDLGLFIHLPIEYHGKNYKGISIACEIKATSNGAPKKAIDQVRTFSDQIKKLFPNYLTFKIVISQSIAYEPVHARKNAEPDIIHVPFEVIKYLVNIQKTSFSENKKLITPIDVINILDHSIKECHLEINTEYVSEISNKIL